LIEEVRILLDRQEKTIQIMKTVINKLERMTSGNISHEKGGCISLLRSEIELILRERERIEVD
jgi:hypothetical protein